MAYLTCFVPVAQGVAMYKGLTDAAVQVKAGADARGRGQLVVDAVVERVTGQATAAAVPVEVELIMTENTLLRGNHEPAQLIGYGPVTAGAARDNPASVWLRRLFSEHGRLVAAESERRIFSAGDAQVPHLARPDVSHAVV